MKKILLIAAVSTTLAACGGGGGGDGGSTTTAAGTPTSPSTTTTAATVTAEGLYVGSTSTGRTVTGLVLDDGSSYVIYTAQNNPAVIAGAVVGNGTSSNGSFTSTNARDINLDGIGFQSATVSGSYRQNTSLTGTVTYPALGQSITFSANYDPAYLNTPTLAAVAGTYSGRVGLPSGTESATLTVSSAGVISGRGSSGCVVSGSITPKAKGNAYTTSVTFGGSPCLLANATVTGAAYFDASTKRLYAVSLNSSRTTGMIFAGSKP